MNSQGKSKSRKIRLSSCLKSPVSSFEPPLDMDKWNNNKFVESSHNCFAYAVDKIDPKYVKDCMKEPKCNVGFPQPGYKAGHNRFGDKEKGCGDMVSRLWGDNPKITASKFHLMCPNNTSKIALIVDPKRDYHFLRQDPDGYWSHKPGALPVKRVDASGRPILRPDRATFIYKDSKDPLTYTDFCGYFCVPRNGKIHMSKDVQKGGFVNEIGDELSSLVSRHSLQRYFQTRRLR
jgi:hypothetical protein